MLLFVSVHEDGLCLRELQAFGGGGDTHKSGAGQDQDRSNDVMARNAAEKKRNSYFLTPV